MHSGFNGTMMMAAGTSVVGSAAHSPLANQKMSSNHNHKELLTANSSQFPPTSATPVAAILPITTTASTSPHPLINLNSFKYISSSTAAASSSATVSPASHSRVSSLAGLKSIVNPSPLSSSHKPAGTSSATIHQKAASSINNTNFNKSTAHVRSESFAIANSGSATATPGLSNNSSSGQISLHAQPQNFFKQSAQQSQQQNINGTTTATNKRNTSKATHPNNSHKQMMQTINLKSFDPSFFNVLSPSHSVNPASIDSPLKGQPVDNQHAFLILKQPQHNQQTKQQLPPQNHPLYQEALQVSGSVPASLGLNIGIKSKQPRSSLTPPTSASNPPNLLISNNSNSSSSGSGSSSHQQKQSTNSPLHPSSSLNAKRTKVISTSVNTITAASSPTAKDIQVKPIASPSSQSKNQVHLHSLSLNNHHHHHPSIIDDRRVTPSHGSNKSPLQSGQASSGAIAQTSAHKQSSSLDPKQQKNTGSSNQIVFGHAGAPQIHRKQTPTNHSTNNNNNNSNNPNHSIINFSASKLAHIPQSQQHASGVGSTTTAAQDQLNKLIHGSLGGNFNRRSAGDFDSFANQLHSQMPPSHAKSSSMNLAYIIQNKSPTQFGFTSEQHNSSALQDCNNLYPATQQQQQQSQSQQYKQSQSQKALSKTLSYSTHANAFYSSNSYNKQQQIQQQASAQSSLSAVQQPLSLPQQQQYMPKIQSNHQLTFPAPLIALVNKQQQQSQHLAEADLLGSSAEKIALGVVEKRRKKNKDQHSTSLLSKLPISPESEGAATFSVAPLAEPSGCSEIKIPNLFAGILEQLEAFRAANSVNPFDHLNDILSQVLQVVHRSPLEELFIRLDRNMRDIAAETLRRQNEILKVSESKQRTIDALNEAILRTQTSANPKHVREQSGGKASKCVEQFTQTTPKSRKKKTNTNPAHQIIQICDEHGNVQEIDTDKENDMLREYIIDQEKKVNTFKEKEANMIKLLLAVKAQGINIDAIYDAQVLNQKTTNQPQQNKKHSNKHDDIDDDDNDSDYAQFEKMFDKPSNLHSQKKSSSSNTGNQDNLKSRERVNAKYFRKLDEDNGYADQSIVNDSEESSFGFYGKKSEDDSSIMMSLQVQSPPKHVYDAKKMQSQASHLEKVKMKVAAGAPVLVGSVSAGAAAGNNRKRMEFKLDLGNLKKFEEIEKQEEGNQQQMPNNFEDAHQVQWQQEEQQRQNQAFQEFVIRKLQVSMDTLDALSNQIQQNPDTLSPEQLDLIVLIHNAQLEFDSQLQAQRAEGEPQRTYPDIFGDSNDSIDISGNILPSDLKIQQLSTNSNILF